MKKIAQNPFNAIEPPPGIASFPGKGSVTDIPIFVSIILKTLIVLAGVYAVFNFVLAGFAYISAGGDSKAIQSASAKIWQSVIGLATAAGAFVIAGVVGWLLFKDWNAILNIQIFEPTP